MDGQAIIGIQLVNSTASSSLQNLSMGETISLNWFQKRAKHRIFSVVILRVLEGNYTPEI